MTYDLQLDRLIDAPPEMVFDAFVDPDSQREPYDDPTDPNWSVESDLDLRVGGTWTIAFGPAGVEPYRETNTFTEVDRPCRLIFDSDLFMVDDGHTVRTKVTITLEERDGKTLLTLRQTGLRAPGGPRGIEGGWPSICDALERIVAARQTGGR